MINVSSEFKQLMKSRTDFQCNAKVTFADGTILELDSSAFTIANNSITDAASASSFPLGVAITRTIQIELLNDREQYFEYDFFGAKIRLYLTFALSATAERIEMGTFTVLEPESYGETVIITARDDMYKADTAYRTALVYPATLAAMFREICDNCGLPFATSNFANNSFVVNTAPVGNLTHRQVLGYIAMIAGGNARINREGDVEILQYNFDEFDTPLHSLKNWKSLRVDTSNIVITGLQTTVKAESSEQEDVVYKFGDEGYMLAVENPLITGKETEALQLMATGFVGIPFRKFSGDHIAYPLAEFMDTVEITDRKGKVYKSFVTDVNFVFFGITTLSNSAESALRNNSLYVAPETKAIIEAQKLVEKERTARENAIAQLNQKLDQAGGFFSTDVEQPDGSAIRYLHDKPTLEASGNVIMITADAIGVSTDGGKTYPYGLEVSGDTIVRLLSAEGISADWITSGAFTIKDKNGNIVFSADADTGVVYWSSFSDIEEQVKNAGGHTTRIESENGFVLTGEQTTQVIARVLKDTIDIDPDGAENYTWYRRVDGGEYYAFATGKTTTVKASDFTENMDVYFKYASDSADYTSAPVRFYKSLDAELDEIRETITERYTSVISTSESIILTALQNYVETADYEEFKQTLSAQLTVMADEILMNFTTTTEQITNVDGDLQSKFTELYKYISFAGGTITLGSSDSAITLTIENDKIVFKRNGAEFGSWDGDYFYTGNIYVRVNESARFGNFAFLPRDDGSLMLQKVGG